MEIEPYKRFEAGAVKVRRFYHGPEARAAQAQRYATCSIGLS